MSTSEVKNPRAVQGEVKPILLGLLDANPYRARIDDTAAVADLMQSIPEVGLLNLIAVRQVGERYEIINGHRRVEAFRQLRDAAPSGEERQRYDAINAQVMPDVSDAQMALSALVENLHRQDLDEVEVARGLARYQQFEDLGIARLAKRVSLNETRVRRLLKLHGAPEFIQDAVRTGLLVSVKDDEDGQPEENAVRQESRRLDLMGALEFLRLFERLAKGAKNETAARKKVEPLIRKALKEGWSVRQIEKACRALRNTRSRRKAAPTAPEPTGTEADGQAADTLPTAEGAAQAQEGGLTEPAEAGGVATWKPKSGSRAWEFVGDQGDILLHPSTFKDLNELERMGLRGLLRRMEEMLGPELTPRTGADKAA